MYTSVISLISRLGCDDLIIDNLSRILTGGTYEFVFVIDNNKFKPLSLLRRLESFKSNNDIRNITLLKSAKPPPRAFNQVERRNRIAYNHNLIKDSLGSSKFVFGFEDDTVLPDKALDDLIGDYKQLDNPGFIEGVQVGRWGNRIIGAWEVDDREKPNEYKSMRNTTSTPWKDQLQRIDAGGFYCFLTPTHPYRAHEFRWDEPLGPDVEYSLSLRRLGYQNYIDWRVQTKHLTSQGILEVDDNIKTLTITNNGRWNSEYK